MLPSHVSNRNPIHTPWIKRWRLSNIVWITVLCKWNSSSRFCVPPFQTWQYTRLSPLKFDYVNCCCFQKTLRSRIDACFVFICSKFILMAQGQFSIPWEWWLLISICSPMWSALWEHTEYLWWPEINICCLFTTEMGIGKSIIKDSHGMLNVALSHQN